MRPIPWAWPLSGSSEHAGSSTWGWQLDDLSVPPLPLGRWQFSDSKYKENEGEAWRRALPCPAGSGPWTACGWTLPLLTGTWSNCGAPAVGVLSTAASRERGWVWLGGGALALPAEGPEVPPGI